MSGLLWLGVALLGGTGAVLRFALDGVVSARFGRELPFGTLAVNVSGSLALGVLAGLALRPDAALLLGTATIGSYTTFSTWMLETHRLAQDGEPDGAAGNLIVSLVLGVAAVVVGRKLGGLL